MAFLSTIDIIGSGFTAQQLRLDVISENVTNMNTTRTADGETGAYRRKVVVFQAEEGRNSFREVLAAARNGQASNLRGTRTAGVRVVGIEEDPSDFKLKYDPDDPDANEDGYLEMPNVDMVKEMTDAIAASQAFSSCVTAFNTLKSVISKGLEIGR